MIEQLQKEVASEKSQARIPATHHVQTAELVQVEQEKAELSTKLSKEREEREKMAETINMLQDKATEPQARWDSHSCHVGALVFV